jgi:AraC-like DNA-binding protein
MEKLELMANIIKNFGVQMLVRYEPLSGLEEYDNGLRLRLFSAFDTGPFKEFIRSMESAAIYFIKDQYGCNYCFFPIKLEDFVIHDEIIGGEGTAIIGPWIETLPNNTDIDNMLQKSGIPYHLKPELAQYFNHLPLILFYRCWEGLLTTIIGYIHNEDKKFHVRHLLFDFGDPSGEYSPKQDVSLSLQLIEKMYKDEDDFLNVIKAGDTGRALQYLAGLGQYQYPQRAPEKIRSGKNYLLELNTLARKIVRESSVHPMHTHTVFTDFAQRIEAAEQEGQLYLICETMVRRYCSLVQEYSLGKYSSVVRNIINAVEFNLKDPLSPSILAKQFNIDPSNLSHHFTREMGMNLTDFINMKRLEYARHLLVGSALYIDEIAEECGYQDVNYFIRLFKRKYGMTPNKYRRSLHPRV